MQGEVANLTLTEGELRGGVLEGDDLEPKPGTSPFMRELACICEMVVHVRVCVHVCVARAGDMRVRVYAIVCFHTQSPTTEIASRSSMKIRVKRRFIF